MAPNEQDRFLFKIRKGLGISDGKPRKIPDIFYKNKEEEEKIFKRVNNRTKKEKEKLLELLIKEAKALKLTIIPVESAKAAAKEIAGLADKKSPEWGEEKQLVTWRHPLIESLNLEKTLDSLDLSIPVQYTDPVIDSEAEDKLLINTRKHVVGSFMGITAADYCLADTATVVMKTRKGEARSVSLVPLIHVCVIQIDQIILNLKELYTVLQNDPKEINEGLTNCMTLITGPSKTADIEGVMIHGAHGPREMYIYVITG